MAHDVFISYSTEDKGIADAMCHHLEERGLRCWIAPRDVRLGEDYAAEIIDAIAGSRALVLIFSANANNSKHVKNEVERGVSHGIPVIPFRTQDVQPARSLELFLGSRHWLDAMTRPLEGHFETLAKHLRVVVDDNSAATAAAATAAPGATSAAAPPVPLAKFSAPYGPARRLSPWLRWLAVALVALLLIGAALIGFDVYHGRGPAPVAARDAPAKAGPPAKEAAAPPIAAPAPAAKTEELPAKAAAAPSIAAPAPAAKTEELPAKEVSSSIGIKLLLLPAGQFMMGNGRSVDQEAKDLGTYYNAFTPENIRDAYPRHRVRITRPFLLGIYQVTRGQFRQFVDATGYKTDAETNGKGGQGFDGAVFLQGPNYTWRNTGFPQTDEHPVVNVSWNDATAFCHWLSAKEGKTYRLPTEAQWEYACRAGTTTRYYNGDDREMLPEVGNVADATYSARFPNVKTIRANDGFLFTAPVGHFRPNAFGLYDMHGNAVQWCADWYARSYYGVAPIDDPSGPDTGTYRVQRGSSWNGRSTCLAAYRVSSLPNVCDNTVGFRVAVTLPPGSPPAAATFTNSIAMKFALIPAGEFQMGETRSVEEELKEFEPLYNTFPTGDLRDEYPRHRVRITRPFYLAIYHVTRGQFRQFVDATGYRTDAEKNGKGGYGYEGGAMVQATKFSWRETGFPQTDEHPVVNMSWNDAVAFCDWLSRKENKKYRLPTEAEWEYACRGGTSTRYWCGDDPESLAEAANAGDAAYLAKFSGVQAIRASDGFAFTAPVGNFRPNSWGLYDMLGNAWQWCWDWYGADYFAASPVDDPAGPDSGVNRVFRGGSWASAPHAMRSSARNDQAPVFSGAFLGFRVARTP